MAIARGTSRVEGGRDILLLFAQGRNKAAQEAEDFGPGPTAEAASDFLADLGHAQVTLGQVIVDGNLKIAHTGQHRGIVANDSIFAYRLG